MKYDLIGDIHGCSQTLEALLEKLGYRTSQNIYRHPDRKVIFLGDFIDRGPGQREVINIVRPMIESGTALSVMCNHEYNAIAYATLNRESGCYLREHSDKNNRQHQAFLEAYADSCQDYESTINWFRTLPLWLDLAGLRIVHACWDKRLMDMLASEYGSEKRLSERLLVDSSQKGNWQYKAVETLLKGKEIPLPEGFSFYDKDGNERNHIRIRWWDSTVRTYRTAFMGPRDVVTHIPEEDIDVDHLIEYGHDEPPIFLGHYWMEGEQVLLAPNIACLDFSVAKPGGKLVAYRWDGEQSLEQENFISVGRCD